MNRRRSSRIIMAMALVALLALTATATAVAGHGGAHKPPLTVQVSGTVTGIGGSGAQAWSMPLAAARVTCSQLGAATLSDTLGRYTLCLNVPHGPYYDGTVLRCSHRFYRHAECLLSADNPQVQNFTLRVKNTELRVIVRSACHPVRNARVYVFGQMGLTGRDGVVVFDNLGLKPLTLYQCTVQNAGRDAKTSSFWSCPGGEETIWVSFRNK